MDPCAMGLLLIMGREREELLHHLCPVRIFACYVRTLRWLSKAKTINHFKPDGTIVLFFKCMDSHGHTQTKFTNYAFVFSESARLRAEYG
jgi:hypothetical protein